MKTRSAAVLAALASLATSGAASAEVAVDATVEKTKTVVVNDAVEVTKTLDIDAAVSALDVEKAAEALALVSQSEGFLRLRESGAGRRDVINRSFSENAGLVVWNQASGNLNNQANVIASAIDTPAATGDGTSAFADAEASVDQRIRPTSDPITMNRIEVVDVAFRDALILASGNDNDGVLFLNQSVGNLNNQTNALALAAGFEDEGIAIADANLGQESLANSVRESDSGGGAGIRKNARIDGSLNRSFGVTGVNQSTGNMVNQGNVLSITTLGQF